MKTPDLTPAASIKFVRAALIWIALFSAEIGAGAILRNYPDSIEYYYWAIGLGCVLFCLLPILGNDAMVHDIQELCLYDIFAMIIDGVMFKNGASSTVYPALAQLIVILQGMRLLWPIFSNRFASDQWPPFGVLGLYRRFSKPMQSTRTISWLYPALICTAGAMYWIIQVPIIRGLPMHEIITLLCVFCGGRFLLAKLTCLDQERLEAIRETIAAQAEADLAKREVDFATARLKDQQIIEAQNAELAASNRRLAQLNATLKNRNAELQTLYEERDQMAQTLAARNDRLGDAIHDQKNNTILMGFRAKLLQDSAVDDEQRETSTVLLGEIEDLARKLMEILQSAKMESNFPKRHGKQIIIVKSFCHYVFERLNPLALQYEVTLRCKYPQSDEPLAIETDEELFRRIIVNLVINAIIHAGPYKDACLTFYGGQAACYVHVYDTGRGMEGLNGPDRVENFDILTERVAQAQSLQAQNNASELPSSYGNGIGLPSVARLCADLGVQVKLRSKPGCGTDFCLKLPLALPELPSET